VYQQDFVKETSIEFLQSIVDRKGLKMTLLSDNYVMIFTPKNLNNK